MAKRRAISALQSAAVAEDINVQILRLLARNPAHSLPEIARELGIALCQVNFVLSSLIAEIEDLYRELPKAADDGSVVGQ